MNVQAINRSGSLKGKVSDVEWKARCELAACYRLMEHFGLSDLSHNQICLRLPDDQNSFLIKRLDAYFHEVTASNLEKYQIDGVPTDDPMDQLRVGGYFHAEIFRARPDIQSTLHAHSTHVMAVGIQKHGLLPMDQHGLHFLGRVAYHDYYGQESDRTLIPYLIRDLADKSILFMRNHGVLVTGKTIGSAFVAHHQLDLACRTQVAALSAGIDNVQLVSEAAQEHAIKRWRAHPDREWPHPKYWEGLMRMAEELYPAYRD